MYSIALIFANLILANKLYAWHSGKLEKIQTRQELWNLIETDLIGFFKVFMFQDISCWQRILGTDWMFHPKFFKILLYHYLKVSEKSIKAFREKASISSNFKQNVHWKILLLSNRDNFIIDVCCGTACFFFWKVTKKPRITNLIPEFFICSAVLTSLNTMTIYCKVISDPTNKVPWMVGWRQIDLWGSSESLNLTSLFSIPFSNFLSTILQIETICHRKLLNIRKV